MFLIKKIFVKYKFLLKYLIKNIKKEIIVLKWIFKNKMKKKIDYNNIEVQIYNIK